MQTRDANNKIVLESMTSRVALREYLFGLNVMNSSGDWDLARAYALGGKHMLSESARARGRLIMEGLLDGFTNAMRTIGQKVSSGWESLKKLGSDAVERAGAVLTALFDRIPHGKEFFDIIKDFTNEAYEQVKEAVANKIDEIKDALIGVRDELLEELTGKDILTDDLLITFREAAAKFGDEAVSWLENLKSSPSQAIKTLMGDRGKIAEFAAKLFRYVLEKNQKAADKIKSFFLDLKPMVDAKTGVLAIGIFKLATGNLSNGEHLVSTAHQIWTGAQRLNKNTMFLEKESDFAGRIMEFLPSAVENLVNGDNPMEVLLRAVGGDPSKIISHAIKLGIQALKKLGEKGVDAAMKAVGIEENGAMWKGIRGTVLGILGMATDKIFESRRNYSRSEKKSTNLSKGNDMRLTVNQLRSIIKEAVALDTQGLEMEGLAIMTESEPQQKTAVLYDVKKAAELIKMIERKDPGANEFAINNVLKGLIIVGTPEENNCWGAWEVKFSAGKGKGKLLYSLGYALSPTRLLASDRNEVSDAAQGSWGSAFRKSKDGTKRAIDARSASDAKDWTRLQFDDASKPEEKRRTPDFPDDDCKVHPESSPQLNFAYRGDINQAMTALGGFRAAHKNFENYVGKKAAIALYGFLMRNEILQPFFNAQRGY